MAAIIVDYYGAYASWADKLEYIHGEKTNDSIEAIVKKVLDAGLNIQILQNALEEKDVLLVWIDSGKFRQR